MSREPFLDILRRSLRWGGFAGLGVYLFAVLTDNPSLYTAKASISGVADTALEHLSLSQLKLVYEAEIRKSREMGMAVTGVPDEDPSLPDR